MSKALRKIGFNVGRDKARRLMRKFGLKAIQRQAYKVTTNSNHHNPIAANVLDRQFNPTSANQAWATDITYLRTGEGWVYLAIVMDLYSRKIVGWALDARMTQALVIRAWMKAIALRNPQPGLIHHSDRGSQYTSKQYLKLLKQHGVQCSMSGKGNCWDNAVVERFFGSLKHEWLAFVRHQTRSSMINDVNDYVRYYNGTRLHSTLGYQSPVEFETSQKNVCIFS